LSDYRIFETDEFLASLSRLDSSQKRLVETKLKKYVYPQLRVQPCHGTNIKKLRGYRPETWRYRVGQFRLFYGIDEQEQIVTVLTIDDRKDAHK
jgi:mRNA interferase RelE/StbE